MTTTIRNDFHNTHATVRANIGDTLTARQTARVQRKLCGVAGCQCGGALRQQDGFVVAEDYDGDGRQVFFLANEWMI